MEPRVFTYDISGAGDPLVLIPGGLTGWLSWIPHQGPLSAHHRVIRVQPIHNELGSAGQPGQPGYTETLERESLLLTVDELGVDRADFAGWSRGGRALINFTLAFPERVRSLALVEPGADWILEELGESDPNLEETNAIMDRLRGKEVTEDDLASFLAKTGFVEDPDQVRRHPNWESWLPHRMALSWEYDPTDRIVRSVGALRAIDCPVLLIKGTTTEPWLARIVDLLGELLPKATVEELEGGHAAHIQSIDRFLEVLEEHLH
ncbi:MAG TPA: alpha/beta hydrolase [Acidimicrobiia bacterium]